jgi:hypothetical protein
MDNTPATLDAFLAGIENFRQTAPVGGKPILKFIKTGQWLLGVANEEVDEQLLAVNPLSIRIGYVAWENGQVVAESPLIPFTQGWPKVDRTSVLDKGAIAQKYLLEGKLIDNDPPVECIFSAATDGGAKAITALIDEVYKKAAAGSKSICPIVELSADSYKHQQYGVTYKPVLRITGWMDIDGNREVEAPKQIEAPKQRRSLV